MIGASMNSRTVSTTALGVAIAVLLSLTVLPAQKATERAAPAAAAAGAARSVAFCAGRTVSDNKTAIATPSAVVDTVRLFMEAPIIHVHGTSRHTQFGGVAVVVAAFRRPDLVH